jgi:hypothetical protein
MACTDDTRATAKAVAINFVMVSSRPRGLEVGGNATGTAPSDEGKPHAERSFRVHKPRLVIRRGRAQGGLR